MARTMPMKDRVHAARNIAIQLSPVLNSLESFGVGWHGYKESNSVWLQKLMEMAEQLAKVTFLYNIQSSVRKLVSIK